MEPVWLVWCVFLLNRKDIYTTGRICLIEDICIWIVKSYNRKTTLYNCVIEVITYVEMTIPTVGRVELSIMSDGSADRNIQLLILGDR